MKKVILAVVALVLFSSFAFGQWEYVKDFAKNTQPHGIVVDNAGKIWIGYYALTDTVLNAAGAKVACAGALVFDNINDTEPTHVNIVTINGVPDTIKTGCRGLALDNNGNVLYSGNQYLWRINYQTFEGMTKYKYPVAGSLTNAACDENGYIYVTMVVPGGKPLVILDTDFNLYSNVIDSCKTIQRALLVSKDGKDVYLGTIYAGVNGVRVYHSDDGPDGTYTLVDTLGTVVPADTTQPTKIMWGQSIDWDPWGNMWVGTYWDVGVNDFRGWYALDPKKDWAIADSIGMSKGAFVAGVPADGGTFYSPRHLAFVQEGGTWYALTNDFDGGVVKLWKNANPYTGVITVENGEVVRNYSLLQNYPNPFNPTTTIPFTLAKKSLVELKIFDIRGSEVMTLVNKNMDEGRYDIPFDATGLATGTYFYRLKVDGQLMTKSMTLVK